MRVAIVSGSNGIGLARDMRLIADLLERAGVEVVCRAMGRGKLRKWFGPAIRHAGNLSSHALRRLPPFDVNLMIQHVRPEFLPQARVNVLIPNPEHFTDRDRRYLGAIDRVFAKTRHAETIFRGLGCDTVFTGFTSADRMLPAVPRERAFFHLAGRSGRKGTRALLDAWARSPDWPRLTVVQASHMATHAPTASNIAYVSGHLGDDALCEMQNAHAFHACPSETEGYGHYIGEAMSVGAVVLTCDGAPMNELVRPDRGVLVPVSRTGHMRLASTWQASPEELIAGINTVLALDVDAAGALGAAARRYFEDSGQAFRERLVAEVGRLVG